MMDSQKTVLAVDDDPDILEIVTDCLEIGGYNVITSQNGAQAIQQLESNRVDLIVVDLGLPDIDGLELTRAMKAISNAGIIILSGRADTTEKVVGLEIGADDYLTKPFEPRELLARARSVMRRAELVGSPGKSDLGENYQFDGWNLNISRREFLTPEGKIMSSPAANLISLRSLLSIPIGFCRGIKF